MYIAVSWLFQDFLQVFLSQNIPVPEYFLLFLLFRVLLQEENDKTAVWVAFTGGILWDLRWTGLPGLSSGLYVFVVLLISWLWHLFPATGRMTWVFYKDPCMECRWVLPRFRFSCSTIVYNSHYYYYGSLFQLESFSI
jgi:hypothetical protein